MIESMIAILILSIGLIGMIKLQISGLKMTAESRFDLVAAARAQDIMEQISTLRLADSAWVFPGANSGQAAALLASWDNSIQQTLPSGAGTISCTTSVCTVVLNWTVPGTTAISNASFLVRN